uniref:Secreted protein n=1 Tax=Steinernema glaseri TaxID=37863 RepID=A0A1I7ZF87_9BILA
MAMPSQDSIILLLYNSLKCCTYNGSLFLLLLFSKFTMGLRSCPLRYRERMSPTALRLPERRSSYVEKAVPYRNPFIQDRSFTHYYRALFYATCYLRSD